MQATVLTDFFSMPCSSCAGDTDLELVAAFLSTSSRGPQLRSYQLCGPVGHASAAPPFKQAYKSMRLHLLCLLWQIFGWHDCCRGYLSHPASRINKHTELSACICGVCCVVVAGLQVAPVLRWSRMALPCACSS